LGVIGWLLLFFLGYLLSGGRADGVNEMAVEFVIPIVTGIIGAVFSLITGVMIVAKRTLPGKVRISFAVLTALLSSVKTKKVSAMQIKRGKQSWIL
jgi:uncharacterized membrane protein YfcA